jgi:hypothetical protein
MKAIIVNRLIAVAAMLVLLLTAIAPTASAQLNKPSFTINSVTVDKNPMAPDIETGTVSVAWTYSFTQVATSVGGAVTPTVQIKWTQPSCDKSGTAIAGSLVQIITLDNTGQKQSASGTATFTLSLSQAAPGETDILCTFKGKVSPVVGTQIPESDEATGTLLVKAKFLGLLTANVPTTIQEAGPQKEIRYEIELTNLGNALTNVDFTLIGNAAAGWSPVPPTPIIMQSQQQGGTEFTKKVNFLIQTPHKNGWNNDETTFQLRITPSSTKDPDLKGNPVAVNVLSRVRGIYVPGPEPILLVAALAGTALVARMLRRDD